MTLRVLYGEVTFCYTGDGRFIGEDITSNRNRGLSHNPTLSTKPYKIVGFEQKEPVPTFESIRAENLKNGEYIVILNGLELPDEKTAEAFKALAKLIWLRNYYNKDWKPDWTIGSTKYCIEREELDILAIDHMYNPRVMYFETNEIRNIFLEDQKDLLKIVKPLL